MTVNQSLLINPMIRGAQDLPDRPLIAAKTDQFPSGRIAVRPPIREISTNQFVSMDRPGWRAYSGTPLPGAG
jgi:hypothetical protein